ncbi:type II toxin-antitoxin system Phd/YefM family antitoxin [Pelomicrobium methylotrophicum]|uniref:Antitoxin n=1 Tax=Pelomicrobium methylotrophicum TaxID=2602750 RepID=A0A5C7ET67_9PROT|nr:type II toxin-antitoxin system prevent-host-death family antitoxin [Pelomicrobium methylotrophicum]TXF10531.1 type II toxin-antitoxin system Phd/YefM family antitoxin [Pelomicrobium methylotrophicum]
MSGIKKSGVEAARKNLSALLEQAYRGEPSLITRHGKVYAAIVPPSYLNKRPGRVDLRALRGTGKGLWGRSVRGAIARMRDEWR